MTGVQTCALPISHEAFPLGFSQGCPTCHRGLSRSSAWKSRKLLISLLILNEIFAWYSNRGCRFFSFSTLNISCHYLLACSVSAERSDVNHMGFPLYVTCCFSLASFNIVPVYLIFVSLLSMFPGMFLLGFILHGTLCTFWTWVTFFFFFWNPYNSNVGAFNMSQRSLRLSSILFILFPLFCS